MMINSNMIREFNKEISYAESFGDNSVEILKGLKELYMELHN